MQSNTIKTPLIFFPGTLCDERIWIPLWQRLNIEQRSYVPLQWADTLESMLALASDRLNSFSEPVHLIGFSMGAYIASLLALENTNNVKSLTLIAYDPFGLSQAELNARKSMLSNIKKNKNTASGNMSQARLAQYFTSNEVQQSEFTQAIVDMNNDLGLATLAAHIQSTTPRKDLTSALSQLAIPQHFIVGEHDQIASKSNIKRYVDKTAQASFTELSNTAHITPLTKTSELANLLMKTMT